MKNLIKILLFLFLVFLSSCNSNLNTGLFKASVLTSWDSLIYEMKSWYNIVPITNMSESKIESLIDNHEYVLKMNTNRNWFDWLKYNARINSSWAYPDNTDSAIVVYLKDDLSFPFTSESGGDTSIKIWAWWNLLWVTSDDIEWVLKKISLDSDFKIWCLKWTSWEKLSDWYKNCMPSDNNAWFLLNSNKSTEEDLNISINTPTISGGDTIAGTDLVDVVDIGTNTGVTVDDKVETVIIDGNIADYTIEQVDNTNEVNVINESNSEIVATIEDVDKTVIKFNDETLVPSYNSESWNMELTKIDWTPEGGVVPAWATDTRATDAGVTDSGETNAGSGGFPYTFPVNFTE